MPISTERLFTLASFEGLKLIRAYAVNQPKLSIADLIALIEKVDPDGASLDLEASAYLHSLIDGDCPLENPLFYRVCIKAVVVKHQPLWSKAMRQGRKRFVQTLSPNDQDVFAAAGLMIDPPPTDVVNWWDDVAGHARLLQDIQKMEQARVAEKLTIDSEVQKLSDLGIDREPLWIGLDDNFAGYDVLSYDLIGEEIVSRMIEVKSTIASPLRFILTRNEWDQAAKIGDAYIFHVWDMGQAPPILHVRTVSQVAPHIPNDQQNGKWSSVAIPLGSA
ncbi:DUF3883 domain-containing protein [Agrobacterium leguminum]|uniref:DUF3883 domain-containing protein n=1 Tax=Agrobacterium leguminum TaxID=2792015 RepID=A0A9X3QXJ2_9HYPH|nr:MULTISPECIES: DUF3883 domain-containing protein [Agrobacterium]MCZ7912296.1 DUF3883 domain-containing protein [Agrobacterium leguminum]RRN73485.1 DUF3883 domain-containing protein [Agrobacterium deltaense]